MRQRRRYRLLFLCFICSCCCCCCCVGQDMYGDCVRHLSASDADSNKFLSSTEFADCIKRLTSGAVDETFRNLGVSLQNAFQEEDQAGLGIDMSTPPSSKHDDLCEAIYVGVLEHLGITANTQRCFLFMSIGDQNRDNLLQKQEFPRYANSMANNQYGGGATFETLPLPLQNVFLHFQNQKENEIDVTGTRPGTQPTAQAKTILTSLCRQTLVAVAAGEQLKTTAPTKAPVEGGTNDNLRFCKTAILAADKSRDEQMDTEEYARFINILSANKFPTITYQQLPQVLQDNFAKHSNDMGVIVIRGARPGQLSKDPQKQQHLQTVCQDTMLALNDAANVPPPPATLAPTPGQVHAYPYTQCTLSMATADRDRSNFLSQEEYVSFLNKLESFAWKDFVYQDLPIPLQNNYQLLTANNGNNYGIDVSGSFPGKPPTPEQHTFLEQVCNDTAFAVDAALYPGKYDAMIPEDGNLTTFNITIYNAFIISTVHNKSIDELFAENQTLYKETLDSAYGDFVSNSVAAFRSTSPTSAKHNIIRDSPKLYLFQGVECPAYEEAEIRDCQIAYGLFDLNAQDETSPTVLTDELTFAIQSSLNQTVGGLQAFAESKEPDFPIIVVGVPENGLVRPPTASPTLAPTAPASATKEKKGGIGTGALVGIIMGGLLLCFAGTCIYCFWDLPGKIRRAKREKAERDEDKASPVITADLTTDDEEDVMTFPKREFRKSSVMHQENSAMDYALDEPSDSQEKTRDDDDSEDPFRRRRKLSYGGESDRGGGYGDSDSGSGSYSSRQSGGDDQDSYGSDYDDEY